MRNAKRAAILTSMLAAAGCGDNGSSGGNYVPVHAVQGAGTASPYDGEALTVQGIVSGDFQNGDHDTQNDLGGFYLQSLAPDDDPRTSEGLFVFDAEAESTDVGIGDRVRVTGEVTEYYGETQLVAAEVQVTGRGVNASPAVLLLPAERVTANADGEPIADFEHYEGMLVRVAERLYVQDLDELERYGALLLSTEPRVWQFTSRERPDPAGFAVYRERVAARSLILDDGRAAHHASPVRYLDPGFADAERPLRVGDSVELPQGVLRYSRGSGPRGSETWRFQPTATPRFVARHGRPPRPDVGGELAVASFNVLNYFPTVDDGDSRCGPARRSGCRGADSAAEFARQQAKLVRAINALDADIVGLMELENNGRDALGSLLAALNREAEGGRWEAVDTGILGNDAIRVAIVYRPARIVPSGDFAVLDGSVDARFDDERNRPVLAQTFRATNSGGRLTVAVNHLKSKGSSCDEIGDPDRGDGQGNCNATRTRAARALADWLASDPTDSGDSDVLIIGDLNAYRYEDPLAALEQAGYVSLLARFEGQSLWTYVWRGRSGALDHALASPSLRAQVTGAAVWHINADEAPLFDYNLEFGRDPALFAAHTPWRASDHDPLLIGLRLRSE